MPDYTVSHGIQYPIAGDRIKSGDSSAKLAADMKALAQTVDTAIDGVGYNRSALTSTDNVDNVTTTGFYPISNSTAPAGLPAGVTVSGLWVGDLLNSTGNVQVQMLITYNPARMYIRDRNTAGVWQPWREQAITNPAHLDQAASRRDTIVDAGIKRRGGVIGTNGLAAVALRFDHHLPEFQSKILPLLKAKRLPWGQMLNSDRVSRGTEGMTYIQIAGECYRSGGEVWNHSYSHSDITLAGQAEREVTQGLADLKAGLPGLYIDGWAPPGQSELMGMEGSDTPAKFWASYPGQLVLAQHAFIRGYYPGIYQTMAGPNLVGAPHTTMDTLDDTYVGGVVRGAVAARAGLTLMLHPNYLDTSGYMTTAQLNTILTDIAAKRDAGELLVLSPTAILLADASTDYRRNLLTSGAGGSLNGTWSETVSSRSAPTQYGVPHELVVTIRTQRAGSTKLLLEETGAGKRFSQAHTVTHEAGEFHTLRCVVTFPLDTAGVYASLSGNVDYSTIQLHAV